MIFGVGLPKRRMSILFDVHDLLEGTTVVAMACSIDVDLAVLGGSRPEFVSLLFKHPKSRST